MKNKIVNIKCYHFEIKDSKIIFFGERGEGDAGYEIHVHLPSLYFFKMLAIECIKRIKKEYTDIVKMYNDIKSI